MNISERSFEKIDKNDLKKLLLGSQKRIFDYFFNSTGKKWLKYYDIKKPLCIALCQGAALHYYDQNNGIKDFDVWFFYPFNKRHLPYRTIWNWDFGDSKFGKHPTIPGFKGRKVDVIVRSIKFYNLQDPIITIYDFFKNEKTKSSIELSKKAVVILYPHKLLGKLVWYKKPVKL